LSWVVNDARRGAHQSAYRVGCASSDENLAKQMFDVWDSGRVESAQSVLVECGGTLGSRKRVVWAVQTWDQHGVASEWSQPATFELGLLHAGDWTAKWIQSPTVGGPYTSPPAAYLRKQFSIDQPIKSARFYVTALGIYECELNGQRVGDAVFAPGRTEYLKRVPYDVYDVTHLVQTGENALGAILGDGWYCGHLHSDPRQTYGDRPKLLAQLEITLNSGRVLTIASDRSWRAGEGPIRSSDMLMGEDYDARLEIPGWSTSAFSTAPSLDDWRAAIEIEGPSIELVARKAPPVRKLREIQPIAAPTRSANKRRNLFDLGQNIVGHVRLRIRSAKPGQTIDLRYTEMLDKDGKPYTTALRSARATDHYTTRGGDQEFFEPRFTFHGFRYVEVRDYPGGAPGVDDLTGIVIHSDTPATGEFECSDPMINQLQSNIIWSQRGNFIDIPTDCPQRDERLGWTGDAQVFIRTAAFNMHVASFFDKWLQDMADTQALAGDGRIHSVVPGVTSIYSEGGPAWADAAVICPWTVYLCYGDTRILADRWEMMSRFMQFLARTCPDHVRADESKKWRGYGDWLSNDAYTPQDLIGVAFYAHCANLMAAIAGVLGKDTDAATYAALSNDVRATWQRRYLNPDGSLSCNTQTAHVLALHFDLLPKQHRPTALAALVKDIEARAMHLSTGFVGTPYLNPVLTRFGRSDVAYALLMQRTFPGWLFPITHGATTMWERWDGWTPEKGFNDAGMNSYNHYAYGAVGEWLYASVAGIDLDPTRPGYKHVIVRPNVGGGLTWARGALRSPYGLISTKWRIDGQSLRLQATIPPNSTATIIVPTTQSKRVTESGRPIGAHPEIELIGDGAQSITIRVPAGTYDFQSAIGT